MKSWIKFWKDAGKRLDDKIILKEYNRIRKDATDKLMKKVTDRMEKTRINDINNHYYVLHKSDVYELSKELEQEYSCQEKSNIDKDGK